MVKLSFPDDPGPTVTVQELPMDSILSFLILVVSILPILIAIFTHLLLLALLLWILVTSL